MKTLEAIYNIFRKFGGWIYLAATLGMYLSSGFLDGMIGKAVFVLFVVLSAADPVVFLGSLLRKKEKRETGLFVAYGLGIAAAVSFFIRMNLSAPVESVSSWHARVRLALLVIFLLGYSASVLYRLALALSAGVVELSTQSLASQKSKYLTNTIYSIFAVVPALILLNYLTALRNPSLDMSPGYYSFSESSRTILKSIDREVQVFAFLPVQQAVRDSDQRSQVTELAKIAEDIRIMLEQLPVINSKISIQFLNADLDTDRLGEFGSVTNGTIVFRVMKTAQITAPDEKPYVERRVYVYSEAEMNKMEKEILRSVLQISSPRKIIYFTASNGERYEFTDRSQQAGGIESLKNELRFYNFDLKKLDHENGWPGSVPKDADALAIIGPTSAFGPEARKAIIDYTISKGRLFITIDQSGGEDFSWLIERLAGAYRFHRAFLSNVESLPGIPVTDNTSPHRITENLTVAGRVLVVFPDSGYFETLPQAAEPNPQPAQTPQISPALPGTPPVPGSPPRTPPTPGTVNPAAPGTPPVPAAVTLDSLMPTGFIYTTFNTVIDVNKNGKKDTGENAGRFALGLAYENSQMPMGAKIALYSGTGWLTELGLRFPVDKRNIILAADTFFWLTESTLAAGLVPEQRQSRSIQVTEELKFKNMVLGILVFPISTGLLLAVGLYVYRKRRKFIGDE